MMGAKIFWNLNIFGAVPVLCVETDPVRECWNIGVDSRAVDPRTPGQLWEVDNCNFVTDNFGKSWLWRWVTSVLWRWFLAELLCVLHQTSEEVLIQLFYSWRASRSRDIQQRVMIQKNKKCHTQWARWGNYNNIDNNLDNNLDDQPLQPNLTTNLDD